jgi:hypothetical protein
VLLDVIMETSDAGLRVANQIRTELKNQLVRIVLRTGQPGQALEHGIILDYDINDFWCKTDLTTRKLFTTVISSLRNYAELAKLTEQQEDATKVLHALQHGESWSGELSIGLPQTCISIQAKPGVEPGDFSVQGKILR